MNSHFDTTPEFYERRTETWKKFNGNFITFIIMKKKIEIYETSDV